MVSPEEWLACDRKKRYGSKRNADRKIAAMKRLGLARGDALNSFECRFCEGWHVGHTPRGKKGT